MPFSLFHIGRGKLFTIHRQQPPKKHKQLMTISTERKYRMVALDLDGTLLNSNHELADEMAAYLRRLHDRGIIVAIATGRCVAESYLISFLYNLHVCSMFVACHAHILSDLLRAQHISSISSNCLQHLLPREDSL